VVAEDPNPDQGTRRYWVGTLHYAKSGEEVIVLDLTEVSEALSVGDFGKPPWPHALWDLRIGDSTITFSEEWTVVFGNTVVAKWRAQRRGAELRGTMELPPPYHRLHHETHDATFRLIDVDSEEGQLLRRRIRQWTLGHS